MSEGTDGGFISVSLVRWMLKQIEKETDLEEIRGPRFSRINPRMVGDKLIDRIAKIDDLCEEFRERIDGEKAMLQEVMKWLHEES